MNFKYKYLAKKLTDEAINKFYLTEKDIFQKNPKLMEIFFNPIDIGDNTVPNGNAIMLINFVRLGMMDEATKLSKSLNEIFKYLQKSYDDIFESFRHF